MSHGNKTNAMNFKLKVNETCGLNIMKSQLGQKESKNAKTELSRSLSFSS